MDTGEKRMREVKTYIFTVSETKCSVSLGGIPQCRAAPDTLVVNKVTFLTIADACKSSTTMYLIIPGSGSSFDRELINRGTIRILNSHLLGSAANESGY